MVNIGAIEQTLVAHPSIAGASIQFHSDGPMIAHLVLRKGFAKFRPLAFSLFYFADAAIDGKSGKYHLYVEGGRFADRHGFEAVWTPERHFHANGGLYPNPSVLSAALATITERVRLRSGSVALPLHHPLRVAEEWSVVDNLSNGRVDLSFTSGWIPNDFAVAPQPGVFRRKREAMYESIEQVRRLWEGGSISVIDGIGKEVQLEIFPKPIQPHLPIWITCSGDPAMFVRTGELGFNVLTALLTQSLEEAAEKVGLFRTARARAGLDPSSGRATLMMHTFVGQDDASVRAEVERPLTEYLKSHLDLMRSMVQTLNLDLDASDLTDPRLVDHLASFAFERYYRFGSLIGTPSRCAPMVERIKELGFDEVACLIDFGVDPESVLASLPHLLEVKAASDAAVEEHQNELRELVRERVGATPPLQFRVVDQLPAAAGAATVTSGPAPSQDIEERARRQRAAQDRQRQLRGGKGNG
jgi:natural product biosynthesis luciferase-like monooxygenase protein